MPCKCSFISKSMLKPVPSSKQEICGCTICTVYAPCGPALLIEGPENEFFNAFDGKILEPGVKAAPRNHHNAEALRKYFPWTKPVPVLREKCSFGCGDRVGYATHSHAQLFKSMEAFPVFAQQSVRELTLTGRTFENIVDTAAFEVFQANYQRGFGADGDHLKDIEKMKESIAAGVTMLTLDLSDVMQPKYADYAVDALEAEFQALPGDYTARLLKSYTEVPELGLSFSRETVMRCALIYTKAIDFTRQVADVLVEMGKDDIDLEISIDETTTPTIPEHHYFIAREMLNRGIKFASLAPRFIGDFQKGIDYIGDLAEFERQFAVHAKIADAIGTYKLSIHSGSDKFSVFPIIARLTKGRFHLKTAGTSWLEAIHAIAVADADLFRTIYATAQATLDDARKLYHVTAPFEKLPKVEELKDTEDFLKLLEPDNVAGRQILHITYGSVIGAKNAELRNRVLKALTDNDAAYAEMLTKHFTHHLRDLNIMKG